MRIVAATNVDLDERINEGGFSQDLYYRIARFTVTVPPLRERTEDIALLAEHFAGLFSQEMGFEPAGISKEALKTLAAAQFPGNIRELKNVVETGADRESGQPDPTPGT